MQGTRGGTEDQSLSLRHFATLRCACVAHDLTGDCHRDRQDRLANSRAVPCPPGVSGVSIVCMKNVTVGFSAMGFI